HRRGGAALPAQRSRVRAKRHGHPQRRGRRFFFSGACFSVAIRARRARRRVHGLDGLLAQRGRSRMVCARGAAGDAQRAAGGALLHRGNESRRFGAGASERCRRDGYQAARSGAALSAARRSGGRTATRRTRSAEQVTRGDGHGEARGRERSLRVGALGAPWDRSRRGFRRGRLRRCNALGHATAARTTNRAARARADRARLCLAAQPAAAGRASRRGALACPAKRDCRMNFEPDHVLQSADRALSPRVLGRGWRCGLPLLAASVLAILAVYWDTAKSIAAIWRSSDTFAHGYLIVPITLILVWTKRREVAALTPRPDALGFLLLAAAGFAWLAAEAAQVQVLMQYALVAMVPGVVLALTGRRVAWALAFPLVFLFLCVPFGEAFLPRLMEWTADFTVAALRLTGIPVYREGTYFAIPSGEWSVAEACSGLRYLIASVTVGVLFAYLTYRAWWKRALFLALSVIVPIVANFLRAYMIVMIGHLSGMNLAVGVDHFIYGWVFFGVVIGLLFWLGWFWRDLQPAY